ncbi:hypothetical protein RHGRI_014215 [Rhododendron griersonianum]|nr:hypothetical protein RHGRI_014215 [Rhododendron griersonianum]
MPFANLRRLQTYAIAWVDLDAKLRTRIDRLGGENPTWNKKFIFQVTSDFLSDDTSGVSVEIFAVGYIKDPLIGTIRFLLSSYISSASGGAIGTPAFTAVQVRRTSDRFHGILNMAATVLDGLDFGAIPASSAICFRDLMGKNHCHTLNFQQKYKGFS